MALTAQSGHLVALVMGTQAPVALVAGAAGLVGSALCHYLLDRGVAVVAVDNFLTGSEANLLPLFNHPGFELLHHDICQPLPPLTGQRIQFIFHLASPASPDDFDPLALEIMAANSQGTLQLLRLAQQTGARLLFSSTSEVYGNPQVHPQPESYWGHVNPLGPRSCYDESKRFGESLITHYARLQGVDYVIARIFNTYGPRMRLDDGRVIPNFIRALKRREPLILHGGGQQTRSFCYVDDLVRGLYLMMMCPEASGRVLNIGNSQEFTIEVLATTLCEVVGLPVNLRVLSSPRPDDPERRCPDIQQFSQLTGWSPQIDLREGLQRTWNALSQTGMAM